MKTTLKPSIGLAVFAGIFLSLPALGAPREEAERPGEVKADIIYKTIGDKELQLDLYYPTQTPKGKYPVVVYTHGGGWAAGSKNALKGGNNMAKTAIGLAEKGFCVAAVQYRLYSKGGTVTIKDCVTDSKDAIRFLSKNSEELHVDTDRVFTFGDSAGGQLAQMLLLCPADLFPGDEELAGESYTTVAGVSWYGPADFQDPQLFNHDDRPDFRDRFGPRILAPDSDPADKAALYKEMSPITYLKKDSPPLLMIQGDGDTTIPVKHAYHMEKLAKQLGTPVETMIIKNAGHNWRKADGKTAIEPGMDVIVQRSIDFLAGHLAE
ncbi:MAG: alpha/beta hydrolase [Akkermansiaceae bacterium]|jgi:acetyl esterase/lipase|nr:alpha/beta hydrolase [Akkermansiaceae bacterium]MDP4646422.1 alpha/beta hydrolase [Akkermansiaceae bacterium]MDP4721302.1 alpha/beta hydrolase [Akkermansiaceae bacterium]MDP4780029.1 alpha/beta hydrolase [Akkermansiaceae bacterium]MDP4845773.1 alpha/beta hydrolase [Akkermansiaceae bacterium]